jgi:hypothetical protein
MPDFTMIEGDGSGPPDWPTVYARQFFRRLVIEILRALARGDDSGLRINEVMRDFIGYASRTSTPSGIIMDDEIRVLFDDALRRDFDDTSSDDQKAILQAALRVVAESLAKDPAAKGRRGSRDEAFRQAIERYVIERERRTRANGWSYTQDLPKVFQVLRRMRNERRSAHRREIKT